MPLENGGRMTSRQGTRLNKGLPRAILILTNYIFIRVYMDIIGIPTNLISPLPPSPYSKTFVIKKNITFFLYVIGDYKLSFFQRQYLIGILTKHLSSSSFAQRIIKIFSG